MARRNNQTTKLQGESVQYRLRCENFHNRIMHFLRSPVRINEFHRPPSCKHLESVAHALIVPDVPEVKVGLRSARVLERSLAGNFGR